MLLQSGFSPFRRMLGAAVLATALAAAPVLAIDSGGGDTGPAAQSQSSAPASGPSMNGARALISAGKWSAAVTMLKAVVAAQPDNADAYNLLGFSQRHAGQMKSALGSYNKALKLNPGLKGAHEYLGELYVEVGQVDKARGQLATLKKLCGNTSCEEYKDLQKVIAGS